jgi:YggT family protein
MESTMVRYALIKLLDIVEILIFVRVIVSWLPIRYNRAIEMLYTLTEPVLAPIRALIQKSMNGGGFMIDFSPIVAFLLLSLLKRIVATVMI